MVFLPAFVLCHGFIPSKYRVALLDCPALLRIVRAIVVSTFDL